MSSIRRFVPGSLVMVDSLKVRDLNFYLSPDEDVSGLADFVIEVPFPGPIVLVIGYESRKESPRSKRRWTSPSVMAHPDDVNVKLLWESRAVWIEERFLKAVDSV